MEKIKSLENKRDKYFVYGLVCGVCSTLFAPLVCITAYYICRSYSINNEVNSLKKEL